MNIVYEMTNQELDALRKLVVVGGTNEIDEITQDEEILKSLDAHGFANYYFVDGIVEVTNAGREFVRSQQPAAVQADDGQGETDWQTEDGIQDLYIAYAKKAVSLGVTAFSKQLWLTFVVIGQVTAIAALREQVRGLEMAHDVVSKQLADLQAAYDELGDRYENES